jgi:hypothetical protein
MSFTAQNMLGGKVLVTGTDTLGNSGVTEVDSTQWDELKARQTFDASTEAFDAAVQEFFAPLTEAAEAVAESAKPKHDKLEYVVLHEGTEGQQAQAEEIVQLTTDSIILRCIEEGQTDRLVWVDASTLGVLSA